MRILEKVKSEYNVPITSDVHDVIQCKYAGDILDIIQIPAFLCRQTDLLLEAGKTGKIVNIKKAQFLNGGDMVHVVAKVASTGNQKIILTEREVITGCQRSCS